MYFLTLLLHSDGNVTCYSRLESSIPGDVHPSHAGVAAQLQSGDRGRRAQARDGRSRLSLQRVSFWNIAVDEYATALTELDAWTALYLSYYLFSVLRPCSVMSASAVRDKHKVKR